MCPRCRAEYEDPADRRFHAQPNACPVCGPALDAPRRLGPAARRRRPRPLRPRGPPGRPPRRHQGPDGLSPGGRRPQRRRRPRTPPPQGPRPEGLCHDGRLGRGDRQAGRGRPGRAGPAGIQGAADRPPARSARATTSRTLVAPRSPYFGFMLPYAPLHYLLFEGDFPPMVMTSGNLSEEPICREDDEAVRRLAGIADLYLMHNRPIQTVCDDSVTMVQRGRPLMLRRGRGYAPRPLVLPRGIAAADPGGRAGTQERRVPGPRTRGLRQPAHRRPEERPGRHLLRGHHRQDRAPAGGPARRHRPRPAPRLSLDAIRPRPRRGRAASASSASSTTTPTSPASWPRTAWRARSSAWRWTAPATAPTARSGAARSFGPRAAAFERLGHLSYVPLPGGDAAIENPVRIAWAFLVLAFGPEEAARHLVGRLAGTVREGPRPSGPT